DLSGGRPYGQYNLSVALVDTVAYIGGWQLKTVSVADPRQPYEIGSRWSPPSYYVPRLTCVEPHLYVACSDGGVCILETLQTGVGELGGCLLPARVLASPSVTRGMVVLDLSSIHLPCELTVYDVLGAEVARQVLRQNRTAQVDLTARSDGVYLLVVRSATENVSLKVTKVWR
ncbi:T9SS type A sorting domain-containing protein, partial [candidate division WOR-3 bacterium]|nr:T9SS type A sorting domain-containing protein [candidate division WOR-3 bacterium]